MAGKERNKVGRPPIEKGKPMTPAERVARYRAKRSNVKAVAQSIRHQDRKNERYAKQHNLEPPSTREARKAR